MIEGREIYVPATVDTANTYGNGTGFSEHFDVDKYSRVVFLAPSSGGSLTEDDAFQLRRVLEVDESNNVVRSMPVIDAGSEILLGANNGQVEVLIRGTYVIEKLMATTESVGVYMTHGIEEAV